MARKSTKSEEPKKKKPISLNILEIAKRLQKLEETGGGGGTPYTLPTASADTKGGVKIGEGLTMTGEVLSVSGVNASNVSYDNTTVKLALDDIIERLSKLESNPLVPVMTSNTTPSGVASSKGGAYSSNNAEFKAFDGEITTEFSSALTSQDDDYIQYDFGSNVTIKYGLITWTLQSPSVTFKNIKIETSTDGTTYNEVYSSAISQSQAEYKFVLDTPVTARYVRCHQIGGRWGGGDNRMIVRELQYYGNVNN